MSSNRVPCIDGKIRNPETGRMIDPLGKTARKVFGENSCALYSCVPKKDFNPKQYQIDATEYFLNSEYPGILLYFSLGAGKTCTAIMMIDYLLKAFPDAYENVYILTPGSLRENFLSQYCTQCGMENNDKFKFITTNYTKIDDKIPTSDELSNSIIVIDEGHDLLNGYMNESIVATQIFENLLGAENSRFIILSGTPVVKSNMDMYYMSKLLAPDMFTDEKEYIRYFEKQKDESDDDFKVRKDEFRTLMSKIVSRVTAAESIEDYPEKKFYNLAIPMTEEQIKEYEPLRNWEKRTFYPSEGIKERDFYEYQEKKSKFYIAYSMIKSRQICNMIYTDEYVSDADIDLEFIRNLGQYSPKLKMFLNILKASPGKHVLYSQFKTSHGVGAIAKVLELKGISYRIFSGDLDDKGRAEITSEWNSESNLRGEKIRILLMTEAGAQGQNFLHARGIHIFEQAINELYIKQVIGRVIRYKSHEALPPEERNIGIFRYFATLKGNKVEDISKNKTSDYDAYLIGKNRLKKIEELMAILDTLKVVPDDFE